MLRATTGKMGHMLRRIIGAAQRILVRQHHILERHIQEQRRRMMQPFQAGPLLHNHHKPRRHKNPVHGSMQMVRHANGARILATNTVIGMWD